MGYFSPLALRTLPLTRTAVSSLLAMMSLRAKQLSEPDDALLEQMLQEFTDPKPGEPNAPGSERHLYRFEEGSTQVFLDGRGIQEFRVHREDGGNETLGETIGIGSFRASIGEHVFIGASARMSMVVGSDDTEQRFDPTQGPIQVPVGKTVFRDQTMGYVALLFKPFEFYVGRMQYGWGAGRNEQLGLSLLNEPMDMVRFVLEFERFRFSYLHANLQGFGEQRFLAGHRLDVDLGHGVHLGAYETVVYAGRNAELAYLNPFVPYHIIEHQLGDRDNNTLGIDLSAHLWRSVRLYADVFIDDLAWTRSLTGYWGNKLATRANIAWAQPLGVRMAEASFEYVRVDPWVYTHHDTLNVYAHHGESIGTRLGPNADRYRMSVALRPLRDLWIESTLHRIRRGAGSLLQPHRSSEGEAKNFLKGIVEEEWGVGLQVRYQWMRDVFAGFEGAYLTRSNAEFTIDKQKTLPSFRLSIDVNY